MKYIILTICLQTLDDDDVIEINVHGTYINVNKKHYIVSVHQGLPIKHVVINDVIITDYIKCGWNDLLLIPVVSSTDAFVFKQFVKKQMDTLAHYYIDTPNHIDTHYCKYINNIFTPIGMIPNNPSIMSFVVNTTNAIITAGSPVYTDTYQLCGIVHKIVGNQLYVIPVYYIFIILSKKNNAIFTINENINDIYKINNYKIVCNKIYCRLHKTYIPVSTFIAVHGDEECYLKVVLKNNVLQRILPCVFVNNMIQLDDNILITNNVIKVTSGFMHWLKICDETALISLLLGNVSKHTTIDCKINGIEYMIELLQT